MSTSTFRKEDGTARSPKELSQLLGVNWSENFDHEDVLALYYKKQGKKKVHCCPEWDYMAIHEGSPEFEACLCDLSDVS